MKLLHKLFAACKKAGYTEITISSKMFTGKEIIVVPDKKDKTGWPAIWEICKKLKIDWGCGWGNGHQVKSNVPTGKWKLIKGRWGKMPCRAANKSS